MTKSLQTNKRLLALLFALFCGMQIGWAYDFSAVCPTGQTLYYNITDATNNCVGVTCPIYIPDHPSWAWDGCPQPTGEMVIPSTVMNGGVTYSVTSIGYYAFYGCSGLTWVKIPNSVTSIGYCAFNGCSNLIWVKIPNSVTLIGDYVFSGCSNLTSVILNSNAIASVNYSSSSNLKIKSQAFQPSR